MTNRVPYYTYSAGILWYKKRIIIGNNGALTAKLLESIPSSSMVGHSGMQASYQRGKLYFLWP